jgi:hypothetical protein
MLQPIRPRIPKPAVGGGAKEPISPGLSSTEQPEAQLQNGRNLAAMDTLIGAHYDGPPYSGWCRAKRLLIHVGSINVRRSFFGYFGLGSHGNLGRTP